MKKVFLFGLIWAFSTIEIHSQRPELRFTDPFENFELSNENITSIAQDTLGFIWIGTRNGLNRFNGYNLHIYKFVSGNPHCLINDQINKLYRDSHGKLWIGTHHGLCHYVPEYDYFKWVAHENDSSGMSGFEIIDMEEDSKSNLYVANALEIYQFQENAGRVIPVFRISGGDIADFLFDKDDNIWIGTIKEGGLIRVDNRTREATFYKHDEENENSISSNSPVSLALQHDKLWIATYDGGVNCFDMKKEIFKKFPVTNQYELYSRVAYVDNTDKVWIVDVTGLKVYDAENDLLSGYYPIENDPYTIKKTCAGIFQDFQGNYWTMHSGEGVGLSIVPKGIITFDNSPQKFWYTTADIISAVGEDKEGNLWLGNPSNGIEIFNWSKASIFRYLYDPSNPYSLGEGAVFSIFQDSDNRMWVGTNMGGLQYYDAKRERFYSYRNKPDDTTSIANNDIRSITEDENGDLWIVVHGKGIDRFDRKKNIFYHYNKERNNLSNDYAFQVLNDSRGNIWVATVWGLSVLKKGDHLFTNYIKIDQDTNSLSDNEIISLFEDQKQRIWVGTSNGINLYNSTNDNFRRYSNGLASTTINIILGDSSGNIWVGTPKGITMLNPANGECINFDQHDGLLSREIYTRAGYINDENALFFGGDKGVNIVPAGRLHFNDIPPRVLITGIKIFNQEIKDYNEKSVLKQHIIYTKSIKLKHSQNIITFEYLALNMINTSRNQYYYQLEGFEKTWINAGNRREVTYTNLDPKRYVFRVIASNNDGLWNKTGASLEVIILPPWYQTLLFRILLIILILSSYVAFHLIRVSRFKKQQIILEQQVRERTLELNGKNELLEKQAEELSDSNTQLEERQQFIEEQSEKLRLQADELYNANQELIQANNTKDKLFSLIAHDLRDPFNTLLGFTDLLSKEYTNISDDQKIKIISMIRISSGRIHGLLENLLKWARSQTGMISVNKRAFRVLDMCNTIVKVFQHSINEKELSINLNIPGELEIFADEDMISTIMRNFLNNAIKFTPTGGIITMETKQKKGKIMISVTDTGIGIDRERLKNIFNPVKNEIERGTSGEKGSGLGLLLSGEFAEKHGGEISVQSKKGKGSTFTLTLPV